MIKAPESVWGTPGRAQSVAAATEWRSRGEEGRVRLAGHQRWESGRYRETIGQCRDDLASPFQGLHSIAS
jgi:hypothetical protein